LAITISITFVSCEKEEPDTMDPMTDPMVEENEYESIDCGMLFTANDFSNVCDLTLSTTDFFDSSGGTGLQTDCPYFIEKENEDGFLFTASINSTVANAASNADGQFILNGSYDPYSSTEVNSIQLNNVGDNAHFYEFKQNTQSNQVINHMGLHVSNSNALLIVISEYDEGDPVPCIHSQENMVEFIQTVISNL